MSHKKKQLIAEAAGVPLKKKLSQIADKDERRFMIEDSVRTLESFARVKREVAELKADNELFAAAKAKLQQKINNEKAAMKS